MPSRVDFGATRDVIGLRHPNLERAVTFETPVLAVHYAEIALKGRNRHAFLRRLRNNILVALKGEPVRGVNHVESRLLVRLDDAGRAEAVAAKLQKVFGVQWLSVAAAVPRARLGDDLAGLGEVAAALARRDVGDARTFRVDARRSDRNFPLGSPEINRLVGNAVGEAIMLPVRLNGADFTVHVLMLHNEALVFTRRLPGPGGSPIGVPSPPQSPSFLIRPSRAMFTVPSFST